MGSIKTPDPNMTARSDAAPPAPSVAPDDMTEGLATKSLLDKMDKLRDLHLGALVPLPQIVVVGDQSSGKSSVLENLTGFTFPRAVTLCTRYATQITCRRDSRAEVLVSIIAAAGASKERKERLKGFSRRVTDLVGGDLADVFEEANRVMGIRPAPGSGDSDSEDDDDDLCTFSEDILKIEIWGPTQSHLTVIDVPGIFRDVTKGLTTEDDINVVYNMAKKYMRDERTIILAIAPCNADIATQEIFRLAREADPKGLRTMGVLTKPDLAVERASQEAVTSLVLGKRNGLRLGYCVVKNRDADDRKSTLAECRAKEKTFFSAPAWSAVVSLERAGIDSLKQRLRDLLVDVTRSSFPKVKAEIIAMLDENRRELDGMGPSRSDANSQRLYLGRMATQFQSVTNLAINAYYADDPIFSAREDMRLVTRIVELNETFADVFAKKGHTHNFHSVSGGDDDDGEGGDSGNDIGGGGDDSLGLAELALTYPELDEILDDDAFACPGPSSESLMDHIEDVFKKSRGPELGTFGGSILGTTFKLQSVKWVGLVLSHVGNAILLVHHFIVRLLKATFQDAKVREALWDSLLLERLQTTYKTALEHAAFLLRIEREGKPLTYNHFFNANLQRCRAARLAEHLKRVGGGGLFDHHSSTRGKQSSGLLTFNVAELQKLTIDKSNATQVREDIHDILESYYRVSRKRFVDVVCQQVVDYLLLTGPDSPLRIICPDLIMSMSEAQLENLAAEDGASKHQRQTLRSKIESLEAAVRVLRG